MEDAASAPPWLFALFVVLLVSSGFFSGTETALFSLDRMQRRHFENDGSLRAQLVHRVLKTPRRLLSTLLFGNTFVNVALSVVATLICERLFGEYGLAAAIAGATILVLIFGELVPKTIAVNAPVALSQFAIMPLTLYSRLASPAVRIFDRAAHGLLTLLKVPEEGDSTLSSSEVEFMLEEAGRAETLTPTETRIARNIMRFSETTAEEIMTPRVDVVSAPLDISREGLTARMIEARHSRIPVYEGDVDNIVGFVSTKEFFLNPERELRELLKPVAIFPEAAKLPRMMRHMQKNRLNMAVIVNEYGETIGIVTTEDLVEEIVGEIYDEYEKAEELIKPVGQDRWIISGRAAVEDVNEALGLALPDSDSVTMNGYLCDEFGEIPPPGRTLDREGYRFTVHESVRRRIVSCRVERLGPREVHAHDA